MAFPWETPSLPLTKIQGTFLLFLLLWSGHHLLRTAEDREKSAANSPGSASKAVCLWEFMAAHSQEGKSRDKTSIFTGKTVRSEAYMGGFCVEMLQSWKKKETGQRKRLLESGTGCLSRWIQAHSFIPSPKSVTLPQPRRGLPGNTLPGGGGWKNSWKGAAASELCLQPCCTGELAFPSAPKADRENKDVREAPAGHSHWTVPEQGSSSAVAAGEDARSSVAIDFAQFYSRLGLFPAPGLGVPRDISHAPSPQLFFLSRAFWGNPISRKAGFFRLEVV